ncbi:MAG TPA: hypothetical protein VKG67_02005 [Gallionellaceae bacterium]|nr:hypothetical protein [Gallionellaceae bacterium]
MTRNNVLFILTAVIAACLALGAHAADQSHVASAHKKKMKMDQPMTTGMMKKGMMKGDVKSAADKKAKEMQPMMQQEEKSMPQDKAKP